VVEHRAGWLDPVFLALTVAGYAGLVWILLAPLLAIWARRPVLAATALTAVCVWSSDLLALAFKELIDRPRPFEVLEQADPLIGATVGDSLPSGHAATSFAGAVVLSYLFRRGLGAFALLALAVSFSRLYVGVHYGSDLLAGAALGTAVALLALGALRLRRPTSEGPRRSEAAPPAG
jgi:undecaprenyl-diphosphatase